MKIKYEGVDFLWLMGFVGAIVIYGLSVYIDFKLGQYIGFSGMAFWAVITMLALGLANHEIDSRYL